MHQKCQIVKSFVISYFLRGSIKAISKTRAQIWSWNSPTTMAISIYCFISCNRKKGVKYKIKNDVYISRKVVICVYIYDFGELHTVLNEDRNCVGKWCVFEDAGKTWLWNRWKLLRSKFAHIQFASLYIDYKRIGNLKICNFA